MKKILLPLLLLSTLALRAQTCGLLLFTENGEKFKLYTNGTLRNNSPQSEVKLCGFPSDIVKVRLEFEDQSKLEKTMYLRMGVIEHHRVLKSASGAWKTVFDNDENIPSNYQNVTVVTVIQVNAGQDKMIGNLVNQPTTVTVVNTHKNCGFPLSDRSFYELYGHLKGLTFESDRLTEAKDAVRRDCFSSDQIKMALGTFDHESSRLEFAQYAYDFVFDKGAYALVKEGFSSPLTGDELDVFLKTK